MLKMAGEIAFVAPLVTLTVIQKRRCDALLPVDALWAETHSLFDRRREDGMSWLKKLFGGVRGLESPKIDIDGMSFDELMDTAEGGWRGVDDRTRVRCLHRAAKSQIRRKI